MKSAPLRFLLSVLALWVGARAAILLPGAAPEVGPATANVATPPSPPAVSLPAPDIADVSIVQRAPIIASTGHKSPLDVREQPAPAPAIMLAAASDAPTIMGLVALGMGMSILPSALRSIRVDEIAWLKIRGADGADASSMTLVYLEDSLKQNAHAEFVALAKANVEQVHSRIVLK